MSADKRWAPRKQGGFRVKSVTHANYPNVGDEHSPEDCPGGGPWPCNGPASRTLADMLRGEAAVELARCFVEAYEQGYRPTTMLPAEARLQYERLSQLLPPTGGHK